METLFQIKLYPKEIENVVESTWGKRIIVVMAKLREKKGCY